MPSLNSYYDLDAILAQEELMPCTTLFDFSYLSHIDPDLEHEGKHVLPENTRVQLPLWAVEKWAHLGYVRLALPKQFGRRARERMEADPTEVDLGKRNERFFLAGRMVLDLVETSSRKVLAMLRSSGSRIRRTTQTTAIEAVANEAIALQQCLLQTYTGRRLQQTLQWALHSVGDDVTAYTHKLSRLEQLLFDTGAHAAAQHLEWQQHGLRRRSAPNRRRPRRAVTPEHEQPPLESSNSNKRPRISI